MSYRTDQKRFTQRKRRVRWEKNPRARVLFRAAPRPRPLGLSCFLQRRAALVSSSLNTKTASAQNLRVSSRRKKKKVLDHCRRTREAFFSFGNFLFWKSSLLSSNVLSFRAFQAVFSDILTSHTEHIFYETLTKPFWRRKKDN